ncbi:hypothetical protein LOZ66_002276 [Ophidiomyces ophidiicola]|nr:hypothetical protein LOZ66_002276 [Ophidiomyces ophidiicola]
MPSTVTFARSWPPAPLVEDESESLLHEIFEDGSAVSLCRDDIQVRSKGSIDQYPIIMPAEAPDPKVKSAHSKRRDVNMKHAHTATEPSNTPPRGITSTAGQSRKRQNKVRFAESQQEQSQNCQPELDSSPSQAIGYPIDIQDGVEYLPEPSDYAQVPTNSQDYETFSCRQYERDQCLLDSRRRARHSDEYTDPNDARYTSRRVSWNTWEREPESDITWKKEKTYEWHSDDEIASCCGTHYTQSRESRRIVTETISTEVSPVRSSPTQIRGRTRDHSRDRYGNQELNVSIAAPTRHQSSIRQYEDLPLYSQRGNAAQEPLKTERSRSRTSRYDSETPYSANDNICARSPAVVTFCSPSRPRASTVSATNSAWRPMDSSNFLLSPCPRSIPMAGYRDWYTISGMGHLDLCPSCANQIRATRFRDLLMLSPPKRPSTKVSCSFGEPWPRLAFVQTMKSGLNHLELLYQITRPPFDGKPCTGRDPSLQAWYRVSNPNTRRDFPDFKACSACVRNLSIIMPSLSNSFRSGLALQEGICDLRVDSTRFISYLDLLDAAVTRSLRERRNDIDMSDFISYAQRKSRIYHCQRDHLVEGKWHYMPELPEFTICEDCYDDIVWPIANTSVAKKISRKLRSLPGSGLVRGKERQASCYLYSPRMRAIFWDAVRFGEFGYLKNAVLRRYDAETKFRQRKTRFFDDIARGYDRDMELRRNADEWKRVA